MSVDLIILVKGEGKVKERLIKFHGLYGNLEDEGR